MFRNLEAPVINRNKLNQHRPVAYNQKKFNNAEDLRNWTIKNYSAFLDAEDLVNLEILMLVEVRDRLTCSSTKEIPITMVITWDGRAFAYEKGINATFTDMSKHVQDNAIQLRRLFTSQCCRTCLNLPYTPIRTVHASPDCLFVATTNDRLRCQVWFNVQYVEEVNLFISPDCQRKVQIKFNSKGKAIEYNGVIHARLTDFCSTLNLLTCSEIAWNKTECASTIPTQLNYAIDDTTSAKILPDGEFSPIDCNSDFNNDDMIAIMGRLDNPTDLLDQARIQFELHIHELTEIEKHAHRQRKVTRVEAYRQGKISVPRQAGVEFAELEEY